MKRVRDGKKSALLQLEELSDWFDAFSPEDLEPTPTPDVLDWPNVAGDDDPSMNINSDYAEEQMCHLNPIDEMESSPSWPVIPFVRPSNSEGVTGEKLPTPVAVEEGKGSEDDYRRMKCRREINIGSYRTVADDLECRGQRDVAFMDTTGVQKESSTKRMVGEIVIKIEKIQQEIGRVVAKHIMAVKDVRGLEEKRLAHKKFFTDKTVKLYYEQIPEELRSLRTYLERVECEDIKAERVDRATQTEVDSTKNQANKRRMTREDDLESVKQAVIEETAMARNIVARSADHGKRGHSDDGSDGLVGERSKYFASEVNSAMESMCCMDISQMEETKSRRVSVIQSPRMSRRKFFLELLSKRGDVINTSWVFTEGMGSRMLDVHGMKQSGGDLEVTFNSRRDRMEALKCLDKFIYEGQPVLEIYDLRVYDGNPSSKDEVTVRQSGFGWCD